MQNIFTRINFSTLIAMTLNRFGTLFFIICHVLMYRWKYHYYYHRHTILCVYFYFLFFIFMWKLLGMNIELRMDPWHYSIYFLGLFYSHLRYFYRWHEYLFCRATGSPPKSLCMEIETHWHSFSCYVNAMNYGYYNLLCYVLSTTTGWGETRSAVLKGY